MPTLEPRISATQGLFTIAGGRNVAFTFALVSTLFLLWGFCNGMIDVMDKHFQEELGLSKAQSAWVQFAHSKLQGRTWEAKIRRI
jgi:FHS family L-fucose permease-like MFS transporter